MMKIIGVKALKKNRMCSKWNVKRCARERISGEKSLSSCKWIANLVLYFNSMWMAKFGWDFKFPSQKADGVFFLLHKCATGPERDKWCLTDGKVLVDEDEQFDRHHLIRWKSFYFYYFITFCSSSNNKNTIQVSKNAQVLVLHSN